jgi:hypothetical protein
MKYYSIRHTLNSKILGHYPQIKDVKYNCHVYEEPKFVGHVFFTKIDFEPIVANPILYSKSNQTDLLEQSGIGFSGKILISGKLRSILEKNRNTGLQFFQCSIFKNGIENKDYWLLNMYEFNQEYIDFEKSVIHYEKHSEDFNVSYKTDKIILNLKNEAEFMDYIKLAQVKAEVISIKNLSLYKNIENDFFALRYVSGGLFFVSEKLKKEIEEAGCTGIEFQPIELSYNEWTMPGGEREKIYGKV